jgi:hypothetical protein
MAKIILNDGTEEYLSPGAARKKVAAGEATFDQAIPTYSTRQMTAEQPAKKKRIRRSKEQIAIDEAAAAESSED